MESLSDQDGEYELVCRKYKASTATHKAIRASAQVIIYGDKQSKVEVSLRIDALVFDASTNNNINQKNSSNMNFNNNNYGTTNIQQGTGNTMTVNISAGTQEALSKVEQALSQNSDKEELTILTIQLFEKTRFDMLELFKDVAMEQVDQRQQMEAMVGVMTEICENLKNGKGAEAKSLYQKVIGMAGNVASNFAANLLAAPFTNTAAAALTQISQ